MSESGSVTLNLFFSVVSDELFFRVVCHCHHGFVMDPLA